MFRNGMLLSLVLSVVLLFSYSYSNAQQVTLPSITGDLLDPSAQNWSGSYGTGWWGGSRIPNTTNPSIPNRLPTDTGFIWGGADNIISTTIAINTALQQAGVQVNGFTYKWRVKNGNANIYAQQPGIDDFIITVDVLDSNGNVYQTYDYDYSHSHNWTTHSGVETFPDAFLPPSYFSDINIYAQGSDSASWSGRYGPEFNVQASELRLVFSTNPCHNNPLYDPQCQGYANALFNQQCTQNPLFDPTCPGYAAAYLTQQCSANPLYDPTCPGYANAYYNQQCNLDPLYDSGCTGYQTAYLNQQCSLDPLYDPLCTGYDDAYLLQQCDLDPLYDITCIGYQQAYVEKQCETDPLYDITCIGYSEAIVLQETTEDFTDIDIVDTTIIQGVPNILSTPEIPSVEIVIEETIVEEEFNITEGDTLAIENEIENEIAELEKIEEEPVEEVVIITEDGSEEELPVGEPKKDDTPKKKSTRNEKMKMLLAQKAIELTKQVEQSVSIEQQMLVQRQLLALISYVPGFDYAEKKLNQVNFYPPKPVVDHAYARWFLNDPRYVEMEDLQYNFK